MKFHFRHLKGKCYDFFKVIYLLCFSEIYDCVVCVYYDFVCLKCLFPLPCIVVHVDIKHQNEERVCEVNHGRVLAPRWIAF